MSVRFRTSTRANLATKSPETGTVVFLTDEGQEGLAIGTGQPGGKELGMSAYQIAVNNGFEGTELEWLASLEGPKGDQGDQGDQGDPGPGLPAGGVFGQYPVKNSSTNYDVSWVDGILTNNLNIYVATTGNDNNDGLTAGTPFRTIQKAVNYVSRLTLRGYIPNIYLAAGTYQENVTLPSVPVSAYCYIRGINTDNTLVTVAPTSGTAFYTTTHGSKWVISHLTIDTINAYSLYCSGTGSVLYLSNLRFGPTTTLAHMRADRNGMILMDSNYWVEGNATYHIDTLWGGHYETVNAITCNLVGGTRAFSDAFVRCYNSRVLMSNVSFVGSATGKRYVVLGNGMIYAVQGASYYPGNASGTISTGGQYI